MGVRVNNTLVRHAAFLAADTLPRVLIIYKNLNFSTMAFHSLHLAELDLMAGWLTKFRHSLKNLKLAVDLNIQFSALFTRLFYRV